jgi:hypothetical protein
MSAVEALRMAQENGIRLGIAGADLILDAEQEPAPAVLEAIRRHKEGIVALLATDHDAWTAEDWQVFYDERAGIAEHSGGVSRDEAEPRAFEWCIHEWMEQHPEPSLPDRCAWCGEPDVTGTLVVPFGTQSHGHTWLHPECWETWFNDRKARAERALKALGIELTDQQAAN